MGGKGGVRVLTVVAVVVAVAARGVVKYQEEW